MALKLAGIDRTTADPSGGELVRDGNGNPTGVFLETAEDVVRKYIPRPTLAQQEQATIDAMRAMNAAGISGVHCMDGDGGIESFKTYQRVRESGKASLRVVKMLPVQALDTIIAGGLRSGFGDDWLRVGNIKIFTDGALGPKTAWMAAPYLGEPKNTGLPIYDPELLVEFTGKAHAAGLGVVVHAIGDRANHEMLNAIEHSRRDNPVTGFRDRIEHAQVLLPGDIKRFAQLGVIASMQPTHCTADMAMVDTVWGDTRAPYAYAMRSLWDSGARLAFGSDAPVESYLPMPGIHAAVTRTRPDKSHAKAGWQNQERVTIDEAIYGFTLGGAYAGYMENAVGSIEPGKLADLTVLSHDLTAIAPDDILNVTVKSRMIGGEWVVQN
jgi:predicted amidohydrolase YtcJ